MSHNSDPRYYTVMSQPLATIRSLPVSILQIFLHVAFYAVAGLFALALIAAPLALFAPHPHAERLQCINNLKNITLAILNYESANQEYPPAATYDANGAPLHSWRVHILPFIEENALYERLDLTLPWNHPSNLKYESEMPDLYRCPSSASGSTDWTTSYVAPSGSHTLWTGKPRSPKTISKPHSEIAIVVEAEQFRQHWMSPYDPSIDQFVATAPDGKMELNVGPHGSRFNAAFLDGSIRTFDENSPIDQLRNMFQIGVDEQSKPSDITK